jgi:hypothetical protein
MDILNSIGIRVRCRNCGGAYLVPLSDVLLSHELLHQGCPVAQETECPPPFQARFAPRLEIEALVRAWRAIEDRARVNGGELVWVGSNPSDAMRIGLSRGSDQKARRDVRDPEDRPVPEMNETAVREKMLDKTLADSYPASDPPSSLPNPSVDSMSAPVMPHLRMRPAA